MSKMGNQLELHVPDHDFHLQQILQVQGCYYLPLSQVQQPPQATRALQSTALPLEIMKRQFLPPELAIIITAIIA